MTEWRKVKLGDMLLVKKGDYITKKEAKEGIYPVILGGREPAYYIDRFNHTGKAIVISRSGASAGYVSYWNEPIFVTDGFLIEPKDNVTFEFLYYTLKSKQRLLHSSQKGAAIPHVTPALINDIDALLPSFPIQRRIAVVLSRYDALIENYQRQIKLLEEAAQRLYKEWFVDLRFPGHQSTPIINNLPQGWEKKSAKDFFTMSIGKTPPRAESSWFSTDDKDVPWVSISDMKDVMFVNITNERLTHEACDHFNVKIVPEGTILLSFKLTVGRVSIADKPVCTNEAIAHFMRDGDNWREYTLMYLRNYHYDSLGNTSGISKAVNSTIIKNMPFVMPSNDILDGFSKMSSPIINRIRNLSTQIRNLSEARDRLLPKLMSAEIEV